ncbi:MAG TPA: DNA repair protein RecO [Blastocatellia bacterium]|nr:DNA repair protein RecO [Blastocatellia bacterium]
MPLRRTEAFVLRTYSLAEADKICVFLTKDDGKVRGVAHGARKMKSRFGSALEPFTQISLSYYEKEGRELVGVRTCDIVRSHFYCAARDVETASAFSYLAELLNEFLPEHEPNERAYRLVAATLDAIEEGHSLPQLVRYFETWLLRLVGFFPDASVCAVCGEPPGAEEALFLTSAGEPRCVNCGGGRGTRLGPGARQMVNQIMRLHPAAFGAADVPQETLTQLREINYLIIRHALERELKSHGLLKQLGAL